MLAPREGEEPGVVSWKWILRAAAVTAALMAGWAWALSSPLTSSPDDDYHQTSIWCPPPLESSGCDLERDEAGTIVGVWVPHPVQASPCYAFLTNDSAACTRTLDDADQVLSTRVDQGDYPGPYYRFMNVFVGEDSTRSILVMRGFNVALAVALLTAIAAVSTPAGGRIVVLATLGTFVPLGMFVTASLNPSSWAVTGVTGTWLALHAALSAREPIRIAAASALALLSATIAAVSRADAGAYVVVVAVAMCLYHWRTLLVVKPLLLVPAAASLLGLWSFLSSGQSGVLEVSAADDVERSPWDVLFYNLMELPGMITGVFGVNWGLGWLDTRSPALTYVCALVVASGLMVGGLRIAHTSKVLAFALVGFTLIALPLYVHQSQLIIIGEGIQPRYLLPLIPALVGFALLGSRANQSVGLGRAQTIFVFVLLVAANSSALHANIRRYVTGQEVWSFHLGRQAEWWWDFGLSPMWLWLVGTAAFAVMACALFLVVDNSTLTDEDPVMDARLRLSR